MFRNLHAALMQSSPIRKMKNKLIAWLAFQISEEWRLHPQPPPPPLAIIDATARLYPEASVANLAGIAGRITVGAYSRIQGRLLTHAHGGRIDIGERCYVGLRSEIGSMESIKIGNRVLIAHDVNILDNTAHSLNFLERYAQSRQRLEKGPPRSWQDIPGIKSAPIVIEDDVWISLGVIILKGVHIGARSVIGAGSIVTDDVPADVLYRCEIKPVMKRLLE